MFKLIQIRDRYRAISMYLELGLDFQPDNWDQQGRL